MSVPRLVAVMRCRLAEFSSLVIPSGYNLWHVPVVSRAPSLFVDDKVLLDLVTTAFDTFNTKRSND